MNATWLLCDVMEHHNYGGKSSNFSSVHNLPSWAEPETLNTWQLGGDGDVLRPARQTMQSLGNQGNVFLLCKLVQEYSGIHCLDVWHFIHMPLMNLHQFHMYAAAYFTDTTLWHIGAHSYCKNLHTEHAPPLYAAVSIPCHNTNRADTEQTVAMYITISCIITAPNNESVSWHPC